MLRGILPILSVGVILVGGVLLAHGDDKDDRDNKDKNGNKKQHQAILNAVNSGNAQHGQLSVGRCDVPPVWGAKITTGRFVSVFGGVAYCDQETGLVWEQSPDTTLRDWSPTLAHCANRTTGGRMGWRLPSAPELASLVDPNNPDGNPDLPAGHPFNIDPSDDYWSATTNADEATKAWDVNFVDSPVVALGNVKTSSPAFGWCVRGGVNAGQH